MISSYVYVVRMFTERYYLHVTYINTIVASIAKTHLTEKCPYVNTYPVPSFPSPTTKKINKKLKTQLKTRKRWKFTQHCIRSNKTPPFSFRIFVNFHPGTGGRERCKTFQQFRYDLRDERNAKKITSWRHPYGGSHNTRAQFGWAQFFGFFSVFVVLESGFRFFWGQHVAGCVFKTHHKLPLFGRMRDTSWSLSKALEFYN